MSVDPFMIRAHVPHWEASIADYRAASEATRRANPGMRSVAYGDGPAETIDLYLPDAPHHAPRPIHLFIHGGYWRAFSKSDYAFMADAITAAGAIAAVMDYALLPVARMEVLVAQARRAASFLRRHAAAWGGDPQELTASGHSAGAHLASFLVSRAAHENVTLPGLRRVLLISGIYDLDPITRSFLQPELQLTGEEVARWSPIGAVPDPGAAVHLLVGELETAPFHAQARRFADHLARAGARSRLTTVPGQDHMTIVREAGRPGTACAGHLADLIRASPRP